MTRLTDAGDEEPGRDRRRRRIVAGAVAVVAVLVAGGGWLLVRDDDEDEAAEATTSTTAEGDEPSTSDGGATSLTVATTTIEPPDDDEPPGFPPEIDLVHGGAAWALYLGVAEDFDVRSPAIQEAERAASDAGYFAGPTELACDQGAAEGLGLDPALGWAGVGLYFADEATAERARDAFEAQGAATVGIAQVTTLCLD